MFAYLGIDNNDPEFEEIARELFSPETPHYCEADRKIDGYLKEMKTDVHSNEAQAGIADQQDRIIDWLCKDLQV